MWQGWKINTSIIIITRKRYNVGRANASSTIDSIVKDWKQAVINTFPVDSPRCAVDNIVDSFYDTENVVHRYYRYFDILLAKGKEKVKDTTNNLFYCKKRHVETKQ